MADPKRKPAMDIKNEIKSALDHLQSGDMKQAEHIFRKILEVQPDNVTALHFIGVLCYQLKDYSSAIRYIKKALEFGPDYADAHNNLGIVLQEAGQLDEAIASYRNVLQLNPDFERAHYNLGTALKAAWQIDDAIAHYQKAIQLNPHIVEAYNNLGLALQDQGKVEEAEQYYRHALRMKPDFALCHSNLLLLMNYSSRHNPQSVFSEHLRFAKNIAEPLYPANLQFPNDPSPSRRLKIGYVSPDFRRHAVACFIEPVLMTYNHDEFEVFCYSDVSVHDEVTNRLQGYTEQWRHIRGMSDEQVAELVHKDGIDILIDLAGYTANNRILLFARKPAPVQVSCIGYLATTGLSTMDYKIVDNYTDPAGKTEQFYTEHLIRLPESLLCFLPDRDSPQVGPLPALSTGRITFGSFNNFAKVTPEVLTVWVEILEGVPESRLILKGFIFHDKATCQYVLNLFTQKGITPERIILQNSEPSPKHLESYNLIDIGLDTFPFNGATTTCEAMWMGVPVIALAGTAYHSGVGTSLLSNIGLPELVARTSDEYVSIAAGLAGELDRLQELRQSLRDRMAHSPLTDAKRFSSNLETCYRKMWVQWCNQGQISLSSRKGQS